MTRRLRLSLMGLGALLLVGSPLVWSLSQPETTTGELPEAYRVEGTDALADGSDAASPSGAAGSSYAQGSADDRAAAPGSDTNGAGEDTDPAVAGEDEDEDDPTSSGTGSIFDGLISNTPQVAPPVSLTIDAIGVDGAAVVDVSLDTNGAVEIPDDVRTVGWYRRGPSPGEPGNAFMTSHVDSRTQGRGVLFDLRRLEPGDRITVTHADGTTSAWEVARRERIVKGSYPMEQVFRFDGPPGLVIDTCGGAFNARTGSYENIDIVYAVPVDGGEVAGA